MGTVYQVYDRTLDETVALKMLGERASSEATLRFRSEIKLARKVAHPNVCRIYEYGEDGQHRFISMEFVDGRTVKERMRTEGPLGVAEACEVVRQAAEALQAIHEAGIIHRDLKTLNLMQDAAGRVRVMDFGIAKPRQAEAPSASEGYTLGTPEYMSPEQARGLPLDHRSDIYSLGIVLFELVTGSVPFEGDSPAEILSKQMHAPALESASAVRLPSTLRPVLLRALAKVPEARYASARQLAEALRDLPPAEETVVQGPPPAPITVTLPRRRRGLGLQTWLGLAALVALVAGLAYQGGRGSRPQAPPPEVVPPGAGNAPIARPHVPVETPRLVRRLRSAASLIEERARPDAVATAMLAEAVEERDKAASALRPAGLETWTATDEPPVGARPADADAHEAVSEPRPIVAEPKGQLRVGIRPWANLFLNGVYRGQTPMAPVELTPGVYTATVMHPAYGQYTRKVTIHAGEITPLAVDLSQLGTWR
jgi:predicted Ser/Thr protein kinase